MANEFDHIDKFFQEKMNGFQIESSEKDAMKFQNKLFRYRFFRFHWNTLNFYYILTIVAILIAFYIKLFALQNNKITVPEKTTNQIIRTQETQTPGKIYPNQKNTMTPVNQENRNIDNAVKNINKPKSASENINEPVQNQIQQGKSTKTENQNPDNGNKIESGNKNKIIVFDTVQTKKKIIVYDTVKTVISKPVKIETKPKRKRRH